MTPVLFANPELSLMISIPQALPLDDLRGPELWFDGHLIGWSELPCDAVEGQHLPGGFWDCFDSKGEPIKVPKVVHQPTGSDVRYAKVESKQLGRYWTIFDDRDGKLWNQMLSQLGGDLVK